ncbi:hypothetical protein M3N64_02410 [Sporolactobacillus sp. CPB3-1]|uniref:Uncharacterized protein n=1 Tax=Sporolactobacillus mangiferae TaxID=2940498 RepID=A0ABT0M7F2_9BACL|nr:hypothetical protein [Sporolactobacillus mangiferae]MCL1630795.1 hypothetical protein [Sporolactobacillus mangiferae]
MKRIKQTIGGLCFALSLGFFGLQCGYFWLHLQFGIEYFDKRYFYLINSLCLCSLSLALIFLLTLKKKSQYLIGGIAAFFIVISGILVAGVGHDEGLTTSLSPDQQRLLVVKTDRRSGRTIYYRPYYWIFVRAKEALPGLPQKPIKIKWITSDVAALTYRSADQQLRQYLATYGSRGNGGYSHVAAEIQGTWQSNEAEVASDTHGISVTANGKTERFQWNQIEQFGTLAVVLKHADQAVWSITLNDDFTPNADAARPAKGTIRLYQATLKETRPQTLHRRQ